MVALTESLQVELEQRDAALRLGALSRPRAHEHLRLLSQPPEALRNPGPARTDRALARIRDEMERTAIAPDEVAARVFEAIGEQRFWILTHDDIDPWVRQRAEGILTRTNPRARPRG